MNPSPFSEEYANLLPPYHLGSRPTAQVLGRYLPLLPSGMFSNWSELLPKDGSWVLDPFGLSPALDLEFAQNSNKVFVCVNNPITRIILECCANPPTETELNHCNNLLANASKAGQRLETHITSLYQTTCAKCGSQVTASAYLWERDAELPYAREYTCPQCWDNGQYPLGSDDEAILSQMRRVPMQRAWAVERIAPQGDPLRQDAEEIVDSHGGRALYVIFNLINRLETLALTDRERLIIHALLLEVLDAASPLHNIDNPNSRPRQLTVPSRYRENNLWLAFQKSIDHWKVASPRIECMEYPQMPTGAGICFYSGRAKDLAKFTDLPEFKKVISVFPRPNQAFWSLSAVWASWLIGRESAASMTQVIARHRYDWTWHTTALASSLRSVPGLLSSEARFLGLVPEIEPAFLATVFHAMNLAGFQSQGVSLRPEDDLGQTVWSIQSAHPSIPPANLASAVRQAAQSFLEEKGEPATYLEMTAIACLAVAKNNAWPGDSTQTSILQMMRAAFSNPILFNHYGSGEQTLESGFWCLRRLPSGEPNTSDRIEETVLNMLAKGGIVNLDEVESQVRNQIRPVFMPLKEYLQHLLLSYAEETPPNSNRWQIRVQEHPALRESDNKTIRAILINLARRLGYESLPGKSVVEWLDPESRQTRYQFFIQSHTRINTIASVPNQSETIRSFVLPGSRSNLLTFKIKTNPVLAEYMKDGWHVLKFRHITRLAENPMLTTDSLQLWLDNDPPEYQPVQMDLF